MPQNTQFQSTKFEFYGAYRFDGISKSLRILVCSAKFEYHQSMVPEIPPEFENH
jgi:hypothetical protein